MSHEPPFDLETYVPATGRALKSACGPKQGGLEYAPDVLYFHFVGLEQVSEWQPFVITNTAPINIGIAALTVTGEFELQGDVPTLLQPDESVELEVRFRPLGEGARLGEIIVEAGEEEPQPKIKLIGIGGTLTVDSEEVLADPDVLEGIEDIVNDLIEGKWAYRYGGFAIADILPSEILLDYHVTATHTLQPNFAGSGFSVTSPPLVAFIMTVHCTVGSESTLIGEIQVNSDGTIQPSTTGGLAIGIPVDSVITVRAPSMYDGSIGRFRMTFVGIVE